MRTLLAAGEEGSERERGEGGEEEARKGIGRWGWLVGWLHGGALRRGGKPRARGGGRSDSREGGKEEEDDFVWDGNIIMAAAAAISSRQSLRAHARTSHPSFLPSLSPLAARRRRKN